MAEKKAEKKERNALDFKLIERVMLEASDEEQAAFAEVAYGYCETYEVICENEKSDYFGKPVRAFRWITDKEEIAKRMAAGEEPSYNKKAAEEWFRENKAEYVPQAKKKTDTKALWRKLKK